MADTIDNMNGNNKQKNQALEIVETAQTDVARAQLLVERLVNEVAPELQVERATIKVGDKMSLNSVNGELDTRDKKYFFKFHSEEGEQGTVGEYYNAELLFENGWPIIKPVFASREPGKQFVVYEHVAAPRSDRLYEALEDRFLAAPDAYRQEDVEGLLRAERTLAGTIRSRYIDTLESSNKDVITGASLNQLFYNRLTIPQSDKKGSRLEEYYLGKNVRLPDGTTIPFDELSKKSWIINDIGYGKSLDALIARSKDLLNPSKEDSVATVIGHGDDHNGNKFYVDGKFLLFDPAFAGRQPALLSFIKATAHNTLLHPRWLYDPQKLEGLLDLKVSIDGDIVNVDHNWKTEDCSPFRLQILDIYAKEVWKPLLKELSDKGMLPEYWRDYVRSALFCCPFLVLNLIGEKYAPAQSILALSKCVELGALGDEETIVEKFLNDIAP